VMILASSGTIWYKLGKLTNEVKHHNRILIDLQKAVEKLVIK
ncbi:unnamed protein product, partial [marine sediment metagenome]